MCLEVNNSVSYTVQIELFRITQSLYCRPINVKSSRPRPLPRRDVCQMIAALRNYRTHSKLNSRTAIPWTSDTYQVRSHAWAKRSCVRHAECFSGDSCLVRLNERGAWVEEGGGAGGGKRRLRPAPLKREFGSLRGGGWGREVPQRPWTEATDSRSPPVETDSQEGG